MSTLDDDEIPTTETGDPFSQGGTAADTGDDQDADADDADSDSDSQDADSDADDA